TFHVNDGTTDSAPATLSLTVTPVNNAPVANNQSVTLEEDTSAAIVLTGSDVDADSLTFSTDTRPTSDVIRACNASTGAMTTTPAVTYTAGHNANAMDSFTFRVNDGTTDSLPATVNLTITAVNDAPVANNQSVTLNENTSAAIVLTGSDLDGDSLTFSIDNNP